MNTQLINIIENIVIIPILTVLTGYIIGFIKIQTQNLKQKYHNEHISQCIDIANNIVIQAVSTVNQTYVDELKKDGIFDKESQKEALEKAKDLVYLLFTKEVSNAIEENYGFVDDWINSRIEYTINNYSNNGNKD